MNQPPKPTNAFYDKDGNLLHPQCKVCGEEASFGKGVALRKGELGVWYCFLHRGSEP